MAILSYIVLFVCSYTCSVVWTDAWTSTRAVSSIQLQRIFNKERAFYLFKLDSFYK